MKSLVTKPFYEYVDFAEHLQPLKDNWKVIRDEGLSIIDTMPKITDGRSNDWYWSPLKPEDEDVIVSDTTGQYATKNKGIATQTIKLCESIANVEAYAFSLLKVGGHMKPHTHDNSFVTCMLGLQVEDTSYIIADGERRDFKEGEFVIFDYRTLHEVYNKSPSDRLLLLVLIPI